MNPLAADLDQILGHPQPLRDELRGKRRFIIGGAGFFGCWLLETFAWTNEKLGLNAAAVACCFQPAVAVQIGRKAESGHSLERYVPSTRRAGVELFLKHSVGLQETIVRVLRHHHSAI